MARAARGRASVLLDALLAGPAWIVLVGVLLAGIVFFNVDLLQLNRDIAATAERTAALKRQNARMRLEVARLSSGERIQRLAAERGLLLPAPSEIRYLRARPAIDGRLAARRLLQPVVPQLAATAPVASAPAAPVQQAPVASQPATPPGPAVPPSQQQSTAPLAQQGTTPPQTGPQQGGITAPPQSAPAAGR